MTYVRNKRLALSLLAFARRLRLTEDEAARRHRIAEEARRLVHGPPLSDAEREQALAEVEARRK